jgi:hypothetical protein
MSMPGFSAELSLYRTNEQYRKAIEAVPTNGGVNPAWTWEDLLEENRPPLRERICWLPYWGFCIDKWGRPYRCMRYQYIC